MEHQSGALKVGNQEILEQVERIVASKSFGASEAMRQLLSYLAQHTVQCPEHAPKEHEIAVELLGRPQDFDPKLDPVVRVQTSRLRSKLAEYYVAEGSNDRVYLEVPKGAYCLQASFRGAGGAPEQWARAVVGRGLPRWVAGALGLIVLAAVAGVVIWRMGVQPGDERLQKFWRPFLEAASDPLLVYSNPRLVGSSTTAMRIFDPAKDHAEEVNPGYTGVGEVIGAAEVTRLFVGFGRSIRFKRSQLFAWDDAKAYNLIFLGAPPHNVSLFQVPLGKKLKIKPYEAEPRKNQGCIQNLFPEKGEEEYYCAYLEGPNSVEYSLVTRAPGVNQTRVVLVVAGTTTFGTQATMEYLCDEKRIEVLNLALETTGQSAAAQFDALFRCRVRGGAPIGAELVLVKK